MKIFNLNNSFPFVKQKNQLDCGIACISMITQYFKNNINYSILQEATNLTKEGVSFQNISETLNKATKEISLMEQENFNNFIANAKYEELDSNLLTFIKKINKIKI